MTDNQKIRENSQKTGENNKKQANEAKIGERCLYKGMLSATEELVQYDGSVLYYIPDEKYPLKITEIDGLYNEDRNIEINHFNFNDYIMHRASVLLYVAFHQFNSPLRKVWRSAGFLLDSEEVDDIWV